MGWWFGIKLWKRVFLGLVLGVAFGLIVSNLLDAAAAETLLTRVRVVGDVFIASIRLVIVPLIFLTLVAGVLALGDPSRLGTIGAKTIALYLATTLFANFIGLAMGTIFQPGRGVDLGSAAPRAVSTESAGVLERLAQIAMKDPFEKLLSGDPTTLALTAMLVAAGAFAAFRSVGAGEKKPVSGVVFAALFSLGVAASSADILTVIFASLPSKMPHGSTRIIRWGLSENISINFVRGRRSCVMARPTAVSKPLIPKGALSNSNILRFM